MTGGAAMLGMCAAGAPAVANHLWQSTVVALVAWLLTTALRKNGARVRFWVWMVASLKFLVPFALLMGLGGRLGALRVAAGGERGGVESVIEVIGEPFGAAAQAGPVATTAAMWGHVVPAVLAAVWVLGFVVVAMAGVVCWWRVRGVMRAAVMLEDGREVEVLRRVEARVGAGSRIVVRRCGAGVAPGIFGVRRPVLLWPEGLSERLGDAELEAIVAHEVWHVRRRDNLLAAVHMVVEALFWFHPAVWWIGARLVDERERACDEAVLRSGGAAESYAQGILTVCTMYAECALRCVSGVTGGNLEGRIMRIMTERMTERLGAGRRVLLASVAIAAVAGPIGYGLVSARPVRAQATGGATAAARADLVTVRASHAADQLRFMRTFPGGFSETNVTAKMLIEFGYNLKQFQVTGGPAWLDTERYDLEVKGMGTEEVEARRRLVQGLLADRFGLRVARESKEVPAYGLVVAAGGPKLALTERASGPETLVSTRVMVKDGKMTVTGGSTVTLAEVLSGELGREVVDQTGMKGMGDFVLDWGRGVTAKDAAVAAALEEQLGLLLQPQQERVDTVTVDEAVKPTLD